jgi:hypothetical protein
MCLGILKENLIKFAVPTVILDKVAADETEERMMTGFERVQRTHGAWHSQR